ncbi:hypothetical protein BGAL_0300g00020 [Botrytis galanthina]|uniref:Uncharacterized protein n=1 Tax=Botrytis galanthina TaxID=278940 RepID=A0A4V4HU12_9HELO|nr:hypothetical protein BGAL_0300g00020 [Botrytis galanthina]
MDSVQKYRLADTLNHLTYPERLFVLELCLLDNRSNLQRVSYHLEALRERRWPTERSELQMDDAARRHKTSITANQRIPYHDDGDRKTFERAE